MSSSSILDPQDTFATLCASVGLDIRLRKALSRLGYVRPTLVQSKCLPLAISSGRDLLVRARTGSGKTLAYCLPVLHKILAQKDNGGGEVTADGGFAKALILVPTRELCTQVSKTLKSLIYYCDELVTVGSLFAGGNANAAALAQQEAMLRDEPDVLVSTPAGLLTHIRSENNVLKSTLKKSVESLVVDEADLVLSFGYANDVTEIMKYLPKICQGFLMSATLSPELDSLKKVVLHSPAVLKLEEEEERDDDDASGKKKDGNLTQFYLGLSKKDKNLVLYVFLKLGLLKGKGLFFVNSIDNGYRIKLFLEQFHIRSAVLNSELPLKSRLNIIEQFNVGNFDYLIATDESTDAGGKQNEEENSDEEIEDEAASKKRKKKRRKKDAEYGVSRGLDFRGVSFVVNVDFPPSAESYTHRIGRTARGSAKGVALSLIENESLDQFVMLEKVQKSQPRLSKASQAADSNLAATAMEEEDQSIDNVQLQPTPLDFDLNEIEGFRYRVEDVSRAVTKIAIRETRAAEIKAEILNSQRLQSHFAENTSDLQLLRHDRTATHVSKVQDHLKHVPKYLLPRGMQVAETKKRKRRKIRNRHGGNVGQRRTDNDPLQSYEGGDVNLDDVGGGEENEDGPADGFDDPLVDGDEGDDQNKKGNSFVAMDTHDGTGKSTAGRNAWKQKHKKGKFSKRYQRQQEKANRY